MSLAGNLFQNLVRESLKSVTFQEPLESQGPQVESQAEEKSKTEEKSKDDEERDEMRAYERINDTCFFINDESSLMTFRCC